MNVGVSSVPHGAIHECHQQGTSSDREHLWLLLQLVLLPKLNGSLTRLELQRRGLPQQSRIIPIGVAKLRLQLPEYENCNLNSSLIINDDDEVMMIIAL